MSAKNSFDTSTILGYVVLLTLAGGVIYYYAGNGDSEGKADGEPLGPETTMVAEDTVASDSADVDSTMIAEESAKTESDGETSGSTGGTNRADGGSRTEGTSGAVSNPSSPSGTSDSAEKEEQSSGGREIDQVDNPQPYVPPQERVEKFWDAVSSQAQRWSRELEDLHKDAGRQQDKLDETPSPPKPGRKKLSIALGDSHKDQYDDLILEAAKEYKINGLALKVIISVESGFRPKARAKSTTAAGLTQVVAPTFRRIYPQFSEMSDEWIQRHLMDPENAIDAGARYYAEFVKPRSSSLRQVFFQYYLGHKSVQALLTPGNPGPVVSTHKEKAARYAQRAIKRYRTWADRLDYEYPPGGDSGVTAGNW